MTAAEPVDVRINPGDSAQRYILYGSGRIDNVGGAPPVTNTSHIQWYDRPDQPIAVALWVTDWTGPGGYVLDVNGGVQPWGTASAITVDNKLDSLGLPYSANARKYVDWSWDPGGSGRFVALDMYGQLYAARGANSPSRSGPRWTGPAAKKLDVRWVAGQPTGAVTMDWYGGLNEDYSATDDNTGPYWPGWDAARDFVVTDWTNPVSGYILDLFGGVHTFGPNATAVYGYPYKKADVARCLAIISLTDPMAYWEVWSGGQSYDKTVSTAPTTTAGGIDATSPPSTVTDTTRPVLAWTYSDAESDSQAAYEVYVFTQAFASGHSMTDPSVWLSSALVYLSGTDPARRGVRADYDFPNGNYRLFVRVRDTSGRWSAFDTKDWTQSVSAPSAPTGLTAIQDISAFSVNLSVHCSTGGTADTVAFGYSDDGGDTWGLVRGADALPLTATTTAVDRDVPCGVTRIYRAVAYNDDPRVVSADSNTASTSLNVYKYLLTSVDDPTLGGEIVVVDTPEWSREAKAGVFEGAGAQYPIVVSDGTPKARRMTLGIEADLKPAWDKIRALIESDSTLVYRDPFGTVAYCRVVGQWTRTQINRFPDRAVENTPKRHSHKISIPLVEVAEPTTLLLADTTPPGPAD